MMNQVSQSLPTVEQINLEYQQAIVAAEDAICLAVASGMITEVHAKAFENNPIALCLQIMNQGAQP